MEIDEYDSGDKWKDDEDDYWKTEEELRIELDKRYNDEDDDEKKLIRIMEKEVNDMEERIQNLIEDIQKLLKEPPTLWNIRKALALMEVCEKLTTININEASYKEYHRRCR